MLFLGNLPPGWKDEMGEISRRIMPFYFEKVEGADSDMWTKLKSERAAILVYSLRQYQRLFKHIKTTPKQEWCYEYFSSAEANEAARKFPLLKMLQEGAFVHFGATYTAEYVHGAVTTVPEQMFDT